MYKKTIGFTFEDSRDGNYTPSGRKVSKGHSPKGRGGKGNISPSVKAMLDFVEQEAEPERSSPRLRAKANRDATAVESGRKDNGGVSEEHKTPSTDAEGKTDMGAFSARMAVWMEDNSMGTKDIVDSKEKRKTSANAEGIGAKGTVSDIATRTQDNDDGKQYNPALSDEGSPPKKMKKHAICRLDGCTRKARVWTSGRCGRCHELYIRSTIGVLRHE